jgi:hypothetical protein
MAFMMNKLAMINSCEIILDKINKFFAKNHCEIHVRTTLTVMMKVLKAPAKLPESTAT